MEDMINSDIIKNTQISLGKYVKRPPLSDKLLRKPPFRFLHDIITSVLKSTGFFNGLFEDEELTSENVKDRDSKILFLTKVISIVGTTTGNTLNVKPSKIIAGQEPEKTNELLQCLALALDNKLSSDKAVELYKESVNSNVSSKKKVKEVAKPVKKVTEIKKIPSKGTDRLVKIDKSNNKTRVRENSTLKKDSPPKKASQISKTINKKEADKEKQESKNSSALNKINDSNVIPKIETEQDSVETDSNITIHGLEITDENKSSARVNSNIENTKEVIDDSRSSMQESELLSQENLINASLENKHIESANFENNINNKDGVNVNISNTNESEILSTDSNKNSLIESSLVTNNENPQKQDDVINSHFEPEINPPAIKDYSFGKRPNSVRPSSSRPGAPRFRDKHEILLSAVDNLVGKVNIIAENITQEEEEETSISIVVNTDTSINAQDQEDQLQISSNQHGHLVQQILNSQKEFSEVNGKTNVWQFGTQKARDVVNQEIEQLRFNVQALSRVANPLGKLLDHIQEDVEVMRQELQQWTKSYEEASKQLVKQKATNEESLFPLHSKIKQLQMDITEKHDRINDLKIVIHKNNFRIEKLLASGNVQ